MDLFDTADATDDDADDAADHFDFPANGATFGNDATLKEARDWLRVRAWLGAKCPCCTQFTKIYRRALPAASARVMIALYRRNQGREFLFLPTILDTMKGTPHQGGYGTLAYFWGLLEQMPGIRDDGSNRVGWWKLTDAGRLFVIGQITVPKYARLYDGHCLGLFGEPWSVRDALGSKFNYDELMGA